MVGVAYTCQTVVVVGYHLSFLRHVRSLLGQEIAEQVVGVRCGAACRVVDLHAVVSHFVNQSGNKINPDPINYDNMICNT